MKKILYITTISSTINRFLVSHIEQLIDDGNIVDCAANLNVNINETLIDKGTKVFNIPFTRNPLDVRNIKAFRQLINIQKENEYDIVHVHTPVAGVYGRLLKLKFPKLKTIYTAHGFHFYKTAPKLNWMIYYSIEKIMSKLTDTIITMNEEDYINALKFKIKNTYKINGVGVDLLKYKLIESNKGDIRKQIGIKEEDFVLLMIAEINKNKNHKQMIDAIEILKNKGIENIKVICAGKGPLLENIRGYIKEKKLQENIIMLGYRNDINDLISACDIGILMSYREGLPRNIMELMACKKPVIGTNIRGIRDLIQDGINGYLVELGNSNETANKIELIYKDREKLEKMGHKSYELVQHYSVDKVLNKLKEVYE